MNTCTCTCGCGLDALAEVYHAFDPPYDWSRERKTLTFQKIMAALDGQGVEDSYERASRIMDKITLRGIAYDLLRDASAFPQYAKHIPAEVDAEIASLRTR